MKRKESSPIVRFALRLPPELHRQLAATAKAEKRSINNQILEILESALEKPMSNKTYRVTTRADVDFTTSVDYLDYFADLDASVATEATGEFCAVGEFLIAAEDAARFEAELDASPAVVRWEVVASNWPAPVR